MTIYHRSSAIASSFSSSLIASSEMSIGTMRFLELVTQRLGRSTTVVSMTHTSSSNQIVETSHSMSEFEHNRAIGGGFLDCRKMSLIVLMLKMKFLTVNVEE